MRERIGLVGVCLALSGLAGGCGGGMTAGEIATSYGRLNSGWLFRGSQQRAVEMIESGEADRMIADGRAKVTEKERDGFEDKILIREYSIQGWVYRVDVHHSIDPMQDVLVSNMRRVEYGPKDRALQTVNPIELGDVLRTISHRSFNGVPETAYRAYVGSDGATHPVRVVPGDVPDWADQNAIDLIVRTENWPAPVAHFRGCRPPGLAKTGKANKPDGRWIVRDSGPAVPCHYFINKDLHSLMVLIGIGQAYNTDLFYLTTN